MGSLCPCCSGKPYEGCCSPLHGGKRAKNALELTRARYSAYVLGLPRYIIDTTHPANPKYVANYKAWAKQIVEFSRKSHFEKLEILAFHESETYAKVTFKAYLSQYGRDAGFTERSHFEKREDFWYYKCGQLLEGKEPSIINEERVKPLLLSYYGDPVLRRKAEPVTEITPDILKLIEDMEETMYAYNGIGLAAPQVHHSIRLFLIRKPVYDEFDNMDFGGTKVFINPRLSKSSGKMATACEGCLSIPTIYANVSRPEEIDVEYLDLKGNLIKNRFAGYEAREIMHENDHLNGVLFIDRISAKDKESLKSALDNLKKRIHGNVNL